MSSVLEQLLATINNQSKWLIAAISLFLSLPVLLPLLFLCSFLVLMLLLPLGCALVGLLSWQRLRRPAAVCPAPIRDEKQENQALAEGVEESELSESDAESRLSDYEEIAEVYQSNDLEELLSREECPDTDVEVESFNDGTANFGTSNDNSRAAAVASTNKLDLQGHDVPDKQLYLSDKQERLSENQDCLSDVLASVDQSALSNEEEETWFQEMQLELEKYETLCAHEADSHHTDWIHWVDTTTPNYNEQQVDWISASDAAQCAKNRGKRGKTSSISSLLSAGSGSISMTSTVCSTSSSSSTTWSAWSEESNRNLHDNGSSKKGSSVVRGRRGTTACNGRGARQREEGARAGQGKRMGIFTANRGKNDMGATLSARTPAWAAAAAPARVHVDGRRGCMKACKEEVGVEVNGQGSRSVCRGSQEAYRTDRGAYSQGGAASKARAVASGRRMAEQAVKRGASETVDSNLYYSKKGNNTARRSVVGASWLVGGAAASAAGARAKPTWPAGTCHVIDSRRHVSSRRRADEATSGASGATSEVEDVRKRMVHVNNEECMSPPYAHIHASADQYPQLLEFWRGIESAFLQVTTPSTSRR